MELNVKAIHPMQRESAGPADGVCVADNPPALLWPAEKGRTVRYAVRWWCGIGMGGPCWGRM